MYNIEINMSLKPFRNSKGVNKPFHSPFSNTPPNVSKNNVNTPESNTLFNNTKSKTPLKLTASKKVLFANIPSPKKLCVNKENNDNHQGIKHNKVLCQNDLESLRKRIQEKQESINNLKRTLSYKKKNKAKDLKIAIKKWTNICQTVLKDYQIELQEKNGQSVTISEILFSLNINPDTVHFSINDDTFY